MIGALLMAAVLVGFGATCGWKRPLIYLWMPVVFILLALYGTPGTDKTTSGLVYEKDSAYNYVQVLNVGTTYYLRLNEGQGVHSVYDPTVLFYNGPWEQVLSAPYFNANHTTTEDVTSMAIVGLAAGTPPGRRHWLSRIYKSMATKSTQKSSMSAGSISI